MSSPNDDENTVFICTHTQALNSGMDMKEWRWTVNTIIRVKDSYSHMNPWTVNDKHDSVFERWLSYSCLSGVMIYPWFLWNDTMTNIQILTINYNKDEQLYTTRMNTIYTRWMLWIRWRYVPCRRAVTVNILFIRINRNLLVNGNRLKHDKTVNNYHTTYKYIYNIHWYETD